MQNVVTLRQAKAHLNLPPDVTVGDADLKLKLEAAHEIVADYLTQRRSDADEWTATVDAWTAATVPARVVHAILLQFGDLYRFRGDDADAPQRAPGELAQGVTALLYRLRDPALA